MVAEPQHVLEVLGPEGIDEAAGNALSGAGGFRRVEAFPAKGAGGSAAVMAGGNREIDGGGGDVGAARRGCAEDICWRRGVRAAVASEEGMGAGAQGGSG